MIAEVSWTLILTTPEKSDMKKRERTALASMFVVAVLTVTFHGSLSDLRP